MRRVRHGGHPGLTAMQTGLKTDVGLITYCGEIYSPCGAPNKRELQSDVEKNSSWLID